MRTTPFNDALHFLIGDTPDHDALGAWKYLLVAAYALLLIGSLALAAHNLSRDPAQRTVRHAVIWLFRVLIGTMWLQGSLWKLPLPVSGGFQYWTGQLAENSAYAWHAAIVRDVLLPHIALLDPAVWLTETFMGCDPDARRGRAARGHRRHPVHAQPLDRPLPFGRRVAVELPVLRVPARLLRP